MVIATGEWISPEVKLLGARVPLSSFDGMYCLRHKRLVSISLSGGENGVYSTYTSLCMVKARMGLYLLMYAASLRMGVCILL